MSWTSKIEEALPNPLIFQLEPPLKWKRDDEFHTRVDCKQLLPSQLSTMEQDEYGRESRIIYIIFRLKSACMPGMSHEVKTLNYSQRMKFLRSKLRFSCEKRTKKSLSIIQQITTRRQINSIAYSLVLPATIFRVRMKSITCR